MKSNNQTNSPTNEYPPLGDPQPEVAVLEHKVENPNRANGKAGGPAVIPAPVGMPVRTPHTSRRHHYDKGDGGSGITQIVHNKQTLLRRGIFVADILRCKGFDNDPRYKNRFGPGEFVDWSGVHLGNFLRAALANPDQFPGLKRLGDLVSLLEELKPVEILTNGCRDNRRIGAALYEHQAELAGDQLVSELLSPTDELRWAGQRSDAARNGKSGAGSADLENLIIHQRFSAGGAKGNTAALMDAWLLTDRLLASGFTKFRIDPVIYLPEVFKTSKQERIKANTHAFLLELAAVYTRSLSKMRIGRYWVDRTPSYTLIKLVNGIDEQGRVYSQQEVYAVEAECWRLSNFGPMADFLESLIPNIVDDMSWPNVAYSQNCRILVVPVDELQKLFALRQEKMLLDHLIKQPDPAEAKQRGRQQAFEWLNQHHLTPREIGKLLAPDLSRRTIEAELKPYQKLKLTALESTLARYQKLKPAAWQEALEKEVDDYAEQLEAGLIEQVQSLLNQPDSSPTGVRFFLESDPEEQVEGLACFLADLKQGLKRNLTRVQTELERHRIKLAKRRFIFGRLWARLFPRSYKRKLLNNTILALSWQLLVLKLQAQINLVDRLEQKVQAHSQALVTWEKALETGSQVVAEQVRQFATQRQHRPVYEENILSQTEEESLFAERIERAFSRAGQGVSFSWQADRWLVQWRTGENTLVFNADELSTSAGVARLLNDYLLRYWADLEELSLEAILEHRGEDPAELIERMQKRCSPLISIDHVQHKVQGGQKEVELRREYILGTQHGRQGLFQGYTCPNGFEIVATGEAGKHRLELLSSVFHVNPLALTQSGAYKVAYGRLRATGYALHIFDETELGLNEAESG